MFPNEKVVEFRREHKGSRVGNMKILDTIVSDFSRKWPILDASVQFQTTVSDFGHSRPISDSVQFWILCSVPFYTLVTRLESSVQNQMVSSKIGRSCRN